MQNYFKPIKKRFKFNYKCGDKFGRLTFTGLTYTKNLHGHWVRYIEAVCDCGIIKEYAFNKINCGDTQSCGCLKRESTSKRAKTHGLSKHPLYDVYKHIISRCYDKDNKAFKNYGGRNIEVWKDWREDFVCFYDWCIENGWKEGLSVDRRENDGNYAPHNCRIATYAEQNRNRRSNRYYTAFGETKCLWDWAKDSRCVVNMWCLRGRADNKLWDGKFEQALTTPPESRKAISSRNKNNYSLTAWGETKCMSDWVKDERCIPALDCLRDRIKSNWNPEKAMTTPTGSVKNKKQLFS